MYDYAIDASFRPFSFKEMIAPYVMYGEAYEKKQELMDALKEKTDVFKYLADELEKDPNSKAAQIYKNYADELERLNADFSKNGLTMGNSGGFNALKRRFNGEIGRLERASDRLKKIRDNRDALRAKGVQMLYGVDNLTINDFLDEKDPNLYGISSDDLYAKGAAVGKGFSSRVFGNPEEGTGTTLGGYFKDYVTKKGISPSDLAKFSDEILNDFSSQVSVLPELQQAAQSILIASGANENLSGDNLRMAQQQVIRGIVDNAIYDEDHKPISNPGVLTAAQKASNALGWANHNESVRQHNLQMQMAGYDPKTGEYDPKKDQSVKKAEAIAAAKNTGKGGGRGKGSSSSRYPQNTNTVVVEWKTKDKSDQATQSTVSKEDVDKISGNAKTYDELDMKQQEAVDRAIGEGDPESYEYYEVPFSDGWFSSPSTKLYIKPRNMKIGNSEDESEQGGWGES